MKTKKIIALVFAALMVLLAMPIVGLAAEDKLGAKATADGFEFKKYIVSDTGFEFYIEKTKLPISNTFRLSFEKQDGTVKAEIKSPGNLAIADESKIDSDDPYIDIRMLNSYDQTQAKPTDLTLTVDNDGDDNDVVYQIKIMFSVPVTTEVGAGGKVTLAQSIVGIVNPAAPFVIENETKKIWYDPSESLIYMVEPKVGYVPVIEGATLYSKTNTVVNKHDTYAKSKEYHVTNKPDEVVKLDASKSVWYVVPDLDYNRAYNVKITFKPEKSEAITALTVDPKELPKEGGNVNVKVEGETIKDTDKLVIGAFLGDATTPEQRLEISGAGTHSLVLKPNATDKDKVYTIKASLDNGNAWSDKTATVTVKNKEATGITGIKLEPTSVPSSGGQVKVSITGTNLDDKKIEVGWFEGENKANVNPLMIDGAGTGYIPVGENSQLKDRTYTVKAKIKDGEWAETTAEYTLKAKAATDPEITGITLSASEVPGTGGSIVATVAGKNLAGKSIQIGWFEGDAQANVNPALVNSEGKATVTMGANNKTTSRTYTVRAKVGDGNWSTESATFTLRPKGTVAEGDIEDITLDKTTLENTGGTVVATVAGAAGKKVELGWFEGYDRANVNPVIITSPGKGNIPVGENTLNYDRVYTVKAKLEGGEWSSKTATFTMKAKGTPAEITGITLDTAIVANGGGKITATVIGNNMSNVPVEIGWFENGARANVFPVIRKGVGQLTITLGANDLAKDRLYTVKVKIGANDWTDKTASFTLKAK